MFSIRIGRMYKRLNSTKSTFSTIHTATNVKLKDSTSVIKPVFLLKNTNADGSTYYYDKADVNYCFWPGYGYYWIDDIVYITNDLIEIYCHRDALATGKPYIEKTTAYVKYCADDSIVPGRHIIDDERFGPNLYLDSVYDSLFSHGIDQGESLIEAAMYGEPTVVLTVVGNGTPPYAIFLSASQYSTFMTKYLQGDDSIISTIDKLTERFMGIDWRSCILSAILVPISKGYLESQYQSTMESIIVGGIEVDIDAELHVTSPTIPFFTTYLRSISFPNILKKNGYTWLKGPKYTKLTYVYPGGSLDLSNEALTDYSLLYIEETLNPFNGEHIIKFFTTDELHHRNIFLGVAKDNISLDLTSMMTSAISGEQTAINFLSNFGSALASIGSAALSMNSASLTQKSSSAAAKKAKTIDLSGQVEGISDTQAISTGISGVFPTGSMQPITKNIEMSTNLDTWIGIDYEGEYHTQKYQLVTSTCIPAAFVGEPTGPDDFRYAQKYDEFAQLFGWPLYQVISLEGVKGYVECVGADVGKVNSEDYEDITYRLHPSEIAEINNNLNSGIYLE